MDSSIPLHKRLNKKTFGLLFFFILLLFFTVAMLLHRDEQLTKTVHQVLPKIEEASLFNTQAKKVSELLKLQNEESSSKALLNQHKEVLALLSKLGKKTSEDKNLIVSSNKMLLEQTDPLIKIAQNSERNEQLKQQAVIQFQLILDNLNSIVQQKASALEVITEKVIKDETNSRATANIAKSYIGLSQKHEFYSSTKKTVVLALSQFSNLSISSTLVEFELLNEQLKNLITSWQAQFSLINEHEQLEQEIYYLVQQLNVILYIEQNTMAKWHSALRISEEYRDIVSSLPVYITPISIKDLPLLIQGISQELAFLPAPVNSVFSQYTQLDAQSIQWTFYGLILLLSIFLLALVLSMKNLVKKFSLEHIADIKTYLISNPEENVLFKSKETYEVVCLIDDIERPKHGEIEYQSLRNDMAEDKAFLLKNNNLCSWRVKETLSELLDNEELCKLLNINRKTFKSWRLVLGKEAVLQVIKVAKLSKSNNTIEHINLVLSSEKALNLSLMFDGSSWRGIVQNTTNESTLESEVGDLKSNLESSQKTHAKSIALISHEFSKMLIKTMLQSQNASIGNGTSSLPIYRQLRRLLEKCRQLQISKALIYSENERKLSEVNIRDELTALFYNLSSEANLQRNHTVLNVCDDVTKHCQLNVRLFHRCIKAIFRLAIGEQFNSSLLFDVSLVDKNSGQQILRMTLDHHLSKPISQLPAQIHELLEIINGGKSEESLLAEYIKSLFLSIHGSNLNGQLTEQGYQLSFDFPITPLDKSNTFESVQKIKELREQQIIFLTEQSAFAKHIQSELKYHEAYVEILSDAKYFTQQLSIKHLKTKPVALIIVGTDFVKSDLVGIKQYLQSLPSSLRPKLMVLQGAYNQPLQRIGLYEQSMQMQSEQNITLAIAKLLKSVEKDNLIIPAEVFHNYRFEQSQVELLLCVNTPDKYQVLVRILHWLGLQVHVVCHSKAMLKHWQTGRYLILITEFDECPYVELSVGNNIPRTVFKLAQQKFLEQKMTKPSHWQQASLPKITDIHAMVSALSPWLNEKSAQINQSKVVVKGDEVNDELVIDKVEPISHEERKFEIEIDEKVFNLKLFSRNQGSAELAGFMIEDYLADLKEEMERFELAIKNSANEEAKLSLAEIKKYAQILSASELLEQVNRISSFIRTLNSPKLSTELMDLKLKHEQLVLVAEAV